MDIFTINLDSRPDRWNRVMAIQRAHPWARLHRLSAIQVPMYPVAGCTASHQMAVLMAMSDERPWVCVAEDDFEPTQFFAAWPSVVAKAEAAGLDYVIGACATSEDSTPPVFDGHIERGNARRPADHGVDLIEARNGRGTHMIVYFRKAYQKVLGFQFGLPIDAALTLHPELRGGFAFPYVAVQGDDYSDLCHRPYRTSSLYIQSAVKWQERLGMDPRGDWDAVLAPVLPVDSGLEAVRRLSFKDVMMGRHRRPPFTLSLEEYERGR